MSNMIPTQHSPGRGNEGSPATNSGNEDLTMEANTRQPSQPATSIAEEPQRHAHLARALEPRMRAALQNLLYGDPSKDRYIGNPTNKQGVVSEESEYQLLSRFTHSAKYLAARWEQINRDLVALQGQGDDPSDDPETAMKPELDAVAAQSGDLIRDVRHFLRIWRNRQAAQALEGEIRSLLEV